MNKEEYKLRTKDVFIKGSHSGTGLYCSTCEAEAGGF